MEIFIPFNTWSKKRLYANHKTATSRNKKYGDVGDTFTVEVSDMNFRQFELTHIERVTLSFVRDKYYFDEGCESEDQFIQIWNEIHPRKKFDDEHKVWLHCFKAIG